MRRALKWLLWLIALVALAAIGGFVWMRMGIAPTTAGPGFHVRFESNIALPEVLERLETRGAVNNPAALRLYARLTRRSAFVKSGTYKIAPGMTADAILDSLARPVAQMVRLPETRWANWSAPILEKHEVCTAAEYKALVKSPQEFKELVPFPLPKASLEGYLFPDTYDLPPLLGAKGVVERQLKAFERKAWPLIKSAKNPYKVLIVASLIEMEVATDKERPIVAGVIENRIKKGMSLGIDAAVNYAVGEWRPLTRADLKVDSPYNLRRFKGLPPTPICSPSAKSIAAAVKPAKHEFLYYALKPGTKTHAFAKTLDEHNHNVAILRKAMRAAQ